MTSALRWQAKKAARKATATAFRVAESVGQRHSVHTKTQVRVLTYHRFGTRPRDPFCVAPRDFDKQMEYVAKQGLAISVAQLEDFIAGRRSLREGSVLVTIDDGFCSTYTKALPILNHYAIPAVAFVTAGFIRACDGESLVPAPVAQPENYMTWDELADLNEAGIAIGSHALTHRSLGRLAKAEIEEEVMRSRHIIEERIGVPVTSFAYPFGTRADYTQTAATALLDSGYRFAFTSQHGSIRCGMEPYTLPRIKVEGGEGLWLFRLLVRGGLDGWRWIDKAFWRIQANRIG